MATPTMSPEFAISSLDDIVGTWINTVKGLNIEFKNNPFSEVFYTRGATLISERYSIESGQVIIGEYLPGPQEAWGKCLTNPEATYLVFITHRGDQPVSLPFERGGEDNCPERIEF